MWKSKLDDFYKEKKQVDEFNSQNEHCKRGVAMVPTKFGVAFGFKCLNQASALVHLQRDGSVLISIGNVMQSIIFVFRWGGNGPRITH